MKKSILAFFFCAALLGACTASRADTAPVQAQAEPVLKGSLPEPRIKSMTASPACAPAPEGYDSNDPALAPDAADDEGLSASGDEQGADAPEACVEDPDAPGQGETTYLYYEDAGLSDLEVCLEATSEQDPFPFDSLLDEFASLPSGPEDNVCLNEPDPGAEDSMPGVPLVVNKSVESFIKYFQTTGRKHFEKWWDRSQRYMVMIREILREDGLPEDLSYIAFIESGLNPRAQSRSHAVGMWQFMKGTAKKYGLRVDWWVDERMDPEKSTRAAANYFTDLYERFGSWYLAAAGYNAGEGRVMKAMKKHGTDDFWALARHSRPLKKETRNYVPKYLAAVMIAKDPVAYGFEEINYNDAQAYDKVKVSQATDLRVIARAAGTDVDVIKDLNPELRRWFTPPNYPGYEVKIPAGTTKRFVENMSKIPPAEKIAFLKHKVRRGDTLSRLARHYHTSVKPIMYLNNLASARRLRPGMVIVIPVRARRLAHTKRSVKAMAQQEARD